MLASQKLSTAFSFKTNNVSFSSTPFKSASFSTKSFAVGSKTPLKPILTQNMIPLGKQFKLMSTKIFVGNLSWSVSEDEIRELFSQHGAVASVKLVTDRETGRAKGFAFVEYEDDKAANNAISSLNGKEFLGRDLRVSKANPPKPRERDSY
jgi:RNA recognition motif-containing protein